MPCTCSLRGVGWRASALGAARHADRWRSAGSGDDRSLRSEGAAGPRNLNGSGAAGAGHRIRRRRVAPWVAHGASPGRCPVWRSMTPGKPTSPVARPRHRQATQAGPASSPATSSRRNARRPVRPMVPARVRRRSCPQRSTWIRGRCTPRPKTDSCCQTGHGRSPARAHLPRWPGWRSMTAGLGRHGADAWPRFYLPGTASIPRT